MVSDIQQSLNLATAQAQQARAANDVAFGVRRAVAAAGGADVAVQYQYGVDASGNLQVASATVTTTERVNAGAAAQTQGDVANRAAAPSPAPALLVLTPSEEADVFSVNAEEQAIIRELVATDASVRRHEAQHFRAAGGLAVGTPEFDYTVGPDGKYYAVGGQVNVQTSSGADPEQANREAISFVNAATAPGDASAQDFAAARLAQQQTLGFDSNKNVTPSGETVDVSA